MTPTRATTYVGLASVLVAWLAGASGVSVSPGPSNAQALRPDASPPRELADEIEAQASRLRGRLATAPAPHYPLRNPFAFAPRAVKAPRAQAARTIESPSDRPPEPPLQLVGVAERETPAGTVRTALITADSDELFMLIAGDTLGGRYRVKTVGADLVELTDLVTTATRRLSLR